MGTSLDGMKKMQLVPSTTPFWPCASLPISFPNAFDHTWSFDELTVF
jgi:hypothetical protein